MRAGAQRLCEEECPNRNCQKHYLPIKSNCDKSETINMVLNGSNMTCLNPDHFLARLNVTGHKYQDITTKDELFLIFDVVMDSDIK